jgi:competence protein ComEC
MQLVLCGFVLGVVMLQQRPALPGLVAWCVGAVLFAVAIAFAVAAPFPRMTNREGARIARLPGYVRLSACVVAATLAGCGYAAWRADLRLRDALPPAWEGRDLVLTGHVRGLPAGDAQGVRFLFSVDVDKAGRESGIANFPPVVQLSWLERANGRVPKVVPGEAWQLTVRLKRPHGYANFGGPDAEAVLFSRGVRASGVVVAPAAARRLGGTQTGLASTIDRWRFAIGSRIQDALAAAPHRGIVLALAIGTADRMLLRRTGTSHLVALN